MQKEMIGTIESKIEKAWKDTGNEFISLRNPKCVFWTETASLKYPFYSNLIRNLTKSSMAKKVSVIPEYRPTVPLNAMCGDKICPCNKAGGHKKQMHIDLCLVKFEKKIYRSDIEYEDNKYRNMWCYKPHPIVAMEFKYYYKFDKWLFDEDIAKLLVMQRVYRTQLLYVCFGTYDRAYVDAALKYIKQRVGQKRSVREKFRLAAGTLDKKDWKILQIK